jgi:hypothetical protein
VPKIDNARYAARRAFGAVKRPLFDAVVAMTGKRWHTTAEYLDFGIYGGVFDAPSEPVQRRLSPGFEVVERRPGWTELEIWGAEYRRVDVLQPYRELGVLAPVRLVRLGEPTLEGQYFLQLVVTTEEARWTGVEIHGFPKIVADIDIEHREGSTRCTGTHRGVHVLTLDVAEQPTAPFDDRAILLNVRHDGRLIRSDFERRGVMGASERPGGVTLTLGQHAIADQLRDIGVRLDSGRGFHLPRCRAVLGKAIELGPALSPTARSATSQDTPPELRPS